MGDALNRNVSILSESPVEDVGRPDLAIAIDGLLVGYIELKAPGEGTTDREFKGRNREQLRKFRALPNLIYTDANDWTFYQKGDSDEKNTRRKSLDVRRGDLIELGYAEITEDDAGALLAMLREFLKWEPIVPTNARALATQLAPLTRILRDNVEEGAQVEHSALASIYVDWRRTLFPEATPAEFADSYAQTFTYGLLLAKLSGATTLDTHDAAQAIPHDADKYPQSLREVRYDDAKRELHVGEGVMGNVDPRIWEYEVSGLRVVRSWLGYRMKERSGRKSSPLDDIRPEHWTWEMTRELLALLRVLEGVIALEPAQDELLGEIVAGDLFLAEELPVPTEVERKAPKAERQQRLL